MQERADQIDRGDRHEPAGKSQRLDADDVERKENPDHRAQGGARGSAQDIWRHQRITEQSLKSRARNRKRRAHQHRRDHARSAHQQHDVLDRWRRRARMPGQPRPQHVEKLLQSDRIAPDRQRNHEPGREYGQRHQESGPG
jgi:hypothetical protein